MRTHGVQKATIAVAVGRAIRARRRKIGRTALAVAAAAHIDRTYLSQIERGLRQPTIYIFLRLAFELKIKPDTLMATVAAQLPADPSDWTV